MATRAPIWKDMATLPEHGNTCGTRELVFVAFRTRLASFSRVCARGYACVKTHSYTPCATKRICAGYVLADGGPGMLDPNRFSRAFRTAVASWASLYGSQEGPPRCCFPNVGLPPLSVCKTVLRLEVGTW